MNSRNKKGETALCLACNGHLDIVKYMISTGHCDMTVRRICR